MKKFFWFEQLFDDLEFYWEEISDKRNTEKEVEFIESSISTESRSLVLDLCCGTARHSIGLMQNGFDVIGLDISPKLLKIAQKKKKVAKINLQLVRGEMRYLPFRDEVFESVISMFTSFGYLPSIREDKNCLSEISRVIKKDGLFLIDVVNKEKLITDFKQRDWGDFPSFYLLEKRALDFDSSKLSSQWIIIDKKQCKVKSFVHNLRLYSKNQMMEMLKEVNLVPLTLYGGYERIMFDQESTRLIILAKKYGV